MENLQKITRKLIVKEAVTESDAVHPRFVEETREHIAKFEKENYYYCKQCNLFFASTYNGLKTHFTDEITTHQATGSCFYCKGKVYEYSLNRNYFVYHNCRDSKPHEDPGVCSTT